MAALAGAEHHALLEILQVDPNDVISRKGLIDRFALHDRWDIKLTLLQNGRRGVIQPPGGTAVENMDTFTWLMTLVVVSLDAALNLASLREVMSDLLTTLFKDQTNGLEYLIHKIPQRIEGWPSIRTIRNITGTSTARMAESGRKGSPSTWFDTTGGHCERYRTASSDAFCIAIILRTIGLDLLSTDVATEEHDENQNGGCFEHETFRARSRAAFLKIESAIGHAHSASAHARVRLTMGREQQQRTTNADDSSKME
ncbi:MAG: hypothetical protein M1830_010308 [Pleopsidium flavum]|nr:MAG: hypothetical protein M1830_010308 [Pleopsidium flavum]